MRSFSLSFALFLTVVGVIGCAASSNEPERIPSATAAGRNAPPPEPPAAAPENPNVSHADLVLPVDDFDPTWGSPTAPVTIVHFFDFECPHSKKADKTLEKLMKSYGPEKLRVVYKAFPLGFRQKAPLAHDAAVALRRLAGDAAFHQLKDRVFDSQNQITTTKLEEWAVETGVPAEELRAELATGHPMAKVIVDQDLGRDLGLFQTPTSFVNGVKMTGAVGKDKLIAQIERELNAAASLRERGVPATLVYEKRLAQNFKPRRTERPSSRSASTASDAVEKWKLPVDASDPIRGPNHAPVTIVIFSDFQCPFCQRVLPTLQQIRNEYGNDVRIVWKDNPLPFHKEAKPAAQVARYVFQKKGTEAFWRVHDALFADRVTLGNAVYQNVLLQEGLSYAAFQSSSKKPLDDKIEENQRQAEAFDARGTPNFFINGVKFTGAQPFEKFKKVIDERLAVAEAMLDDGVALDSIYEETLKSAQEPAGEPEKVVPAPFVDTPFVGNKNAKIVVQEFADFQCPFCRRAEKTIAEFLANHSGEVVFYFRHLPLPFHKDAPLAAEAAHEVYVQKGNAAFFRFKDQVFHVGGSGQPKVSRPELEAIARALGVNMKAFKAALDTRKHQKRIEADMDVAKAAKITGTPAFVVGDVYVSGAQPLSKFESALRQAKKNAGL